MQVTPDIKIPYNTEGVIRTAQLDDTVAPENSVQLMVNMNSDQIGAMKTRLGITEYADQLASSVRNFGTLNNFAILDGYAEFFNLGPNLTIDGSATIGITSAAVVDDNHYILFRRGVADDGFVQIIEGNLETGVLSLVGTPLEFDTNANDLNACIKVDDTHFLNVWRGPDDDGFAQVFSVNTTTWNVSAVGSAFEFDPADASNMAISQIDANHFILFYSGTAGVGKAVVLEVNLSTYAVTAPGATLTFDATTATYNSCQPLGDGTRFINFWRHNTTVGYAQVFSVNTSTWAITALDSPFTFEGGSNRYNSCQPLGDGQRFINFWENTYDGVTQVFSVNLSTYAVTAIGTPFSFTTANGIGNSAASAGDGEHFVNGWLDNPGPNGYIQMFVVDQSTYAVTAMDSPILTSASGTGIYRFVLNVNGYRFVNFQGTSTTTTIAGMYASISAPTPQRLLYAQIQNGDVLTWDGSTWTTRRSGLQTNSKARFAQYLNLIWMVNGNALIGDPVMTSNGGNFSTTMVPADFPPVDFIQAGFEGRIWGLDNTYGIVYYTDIVQFTPPDVYTITFDPDVNFIKNIAPQNGETFTGIFEVPRALLIFTQNHIYRIYGATSLDAYPAYNVGTYSQESIVETKTGIFFHHSSGFYQFDYGGQPVEISRRISDFIKAIPRANYENIIGVWDGYDAIEWYVGQVVVEGVVFSNCVLRYTISTQIWTIYDYPNNTMTAMIRYDDGTNDQHLVGTSTGKVGALDTGYDDFGVPFYYEFIDRWRSFTALYSRVKTLDGINLYSENAAGANVMYQIQKAGPNAWENIGSVDENNNSLFPNVTTDDFEVIRFRVAGTTSGVPVIIHGIEIQSLTDKGFNKN